MARTTQEVFDAIKAEAIALATAAGNQSAIDMFNNTSRVAIWKIIFYAVAFCIHVFEEILDLFRTEIDDRVEALKPHSERWYAEMAKKFQFGYNLVDETDGYDNTGLTQQQIDDSLIIAHAAVVEQTRGIRIKVARLVSGELAALTDPQLDAFIEYMERIKDAGIKLLITSDAADDLQAELRIYYNPLVLADDGSRLDGTAATPVQDAFESYLKSLPFNGLFVPQLMIDKLQAVDGVVIVKDDLWLARYGALAYASIDVEYQPDAGYLRLINNGLTLTFIPHSVI